MNSDALLCLDLDVGPNEASDLLAVRNESVLEEQGWDRAFWTVLDEVQVEDGVAVLGHRRGHGEDDAAAWETRVVRTHRTSSGGRTEDSEACARSDGWIYVFGSQFGSKSGPLDPSRSFVARFREADAPGRLAASVPLDVARAGFRIHRAVNDGLARVGPPLFDTAPAVADAFVAAARRRGEKKGKGWAERLHPGDNPINVEGAAFRKDGSLLLGLRFPVTAEGDPMVVELTGIEGLFEKDKRGPEVTRVWVLEGAGGSRAPAGIRALREENGVLHVVTGSVERAKEGGVLLQEHPECEAAESAHWRVELPDQNGGSVQPERVRGFPGVKNVEGLAPDEQGRLHYVTDEDERVQLRVSTG